MLKKLVIAALLASPAAFAQVTAGKVPPSEVILQQLVEDIRTTKDAEHRRLLQEAYAFARKGEYKHPVLKAYLDTRMSESQVSSLLHRLQALALGFTEYVMDSRRPPRYIEQLVINDRSPNWRGPYVAPEFVQGSDSYTGISLRYITQPRADGLPNLEEACTENTCLALLTFENVPVETVVLVRDELSRNKAGVQFIEGPILPGETRINLHYPLGMVAAPANN